MINTEVRLLVVYIFMDLEIHLIYKSQRHLVFNTGKYEWQIEMEAMIRSARKKKETPSKAYAAFWNECEQRDKATPH